MIHTIGNCRYSLVVKQSAVNRQTIGSNPFIYAKKRRKKMRVWHRQEINGDIVHKTMKSTTSHASITQAVQSTRLLTWESEVRILLGAQMDI